MKRIEAAHTYLASGRGFAASVIVVALFFLLQDGFFTLDGWAHGSNAQWTRALLGGDPAFEGFARFNPFPVPNWTGHALLTALQVILPPLWAEKVLLLIILLLLGAGCYRFTRAWCGQPNLLIVLCLPVFLSNLFILGFYNFLLATGLVFWLTGWWWERGRNLRWRWVLFIASTFAVYVSHGSAVPVYLMIVGACEVWVALFGTEKGMGSGWQRWSSLVGMVLCAMPVAALLWMFNEGQPRDWSGFTAAELMEKATSLFWLVFYDGQREATLLLMFKAALVVAICLAAYGLCHEGGRRNRVVLPIALGVVMFAAYFILPDDTGYANYISLRCFILGLLLVVIGLAGAPVRSPWPLLPALLAIGCVAGKLHYVSQVAAERRADRDVVLRAAERFKPGDVVLPVDRDDMWLYAHRPSLLSLDKAVRLLDNYECTKGYFPLVWDPHLPAAFGAQVHYADGCHAAMRTHMRQQDAPLVDHVVFMGARLDSAECSVKELLAITDSLGYTTTFKEGDVMVRSRP